MFYDIYDYSGSYTNIWLNTVQSCHHCACFIPEKGKILLFSPKALKDHLQNFEISNVAELLFWKSRIFQKSSMFDRKYQLEPHTPVAFLDWSIINLTERELPLQYNTNTETYTDKRMESQVCTNWTYRLNISPHKIL